MGICLKMSRVQYSVSRMPSMSPNSIACDMAAADGWKLESIEEWKFCTWPLISLKMKNTEEYKWNQSLVFKSIKCRFLDQHINCFFKIPVLAFGLIFLREREMIFSPISIIISPHNLRKTRINNHYLSGRQETIPLCILLHFLKRLTSESSIHSVNFLHQISR